MGSWGLGLYDIDMTMDLRDDFRSVCRAPWDGEALLAWATHAYPMAADPTDDDHTDVRLALADLFWTYGIEHADTMDVARQIHADGTDVAKKRELGMSERDLLRRGRLLAKLEAKWSLPNPTPRPRRIMTQGKAFTFQEGDCLVYPTSKGRLRNPYVSPAREAEYDRIHAWSQDGWGAAIVLAHHRQFDIFACHVIALLASSAPTRPDSEPSSDSAPSIRRHRSRWIRPTPSDPPGAAYSRSRCRRRTAYACGSRSSEGCQ